MKRCKSFVVVFYWWTVNKRLGAFVILFTFQFRFSSYHSRAHPWIPPCWQDQDLCCRSPFPGQEEWIFCQFPLRFLKPFLLHSAFANAFGLLPCSLVLWLHLALVCLVRSLLDLVYDLLSAFSFFLQSSNCVCHRRYCTRKTPRLLLPKRESREGTWLPANRRKCFHQLAFSRWDSGRDHCIRYRS